MNTSARWFSSTVLSCVAFVLYTHTAAPQTTETPTQDAGAKFEVKVNAVLVPVVVRDAQGRTVGNLKREDFQVFDQNKLQIISGFSIQKRAVVESSPAP